MSLSSFFSCRHCLSLSEAHLPRSRSCRSALYWPTALAFLPGAKPTACTLRQPHVCAGKTVVQVDGGAPAARYSGSAAGAGGQRDWGVWTRDAGLWQEGALRAWLPARHPAALVVVQAGLHNFLWYKEGVVRLDRLCCGIAIPSGSHGRTVERAIQADKYSKTG